MCISLFTSAILGGLIGLERQLRGHDAGIRTFALICMGSALAMRISTNFNSGDPGRIAAQVVSGISFLGAGIILHSKDKVYGLTTAACTWITAVIGLAIGSEMYVDAIATTILVILLVVIIDKINKK